MRHHSVRRERSDRMAEDLLANPHMDPDGLARFQSAVASSRCYLEYGSGGSTIYANTIARVPAIITVESDRAWAQRVAAALDKQASRIFIAHCDIGETGAWGAPTNTDKAHNFWQYMVAPWDLAKKHGQVPDTVLIDGRFRVASFLYSLLASRVGTTILFDDYFDRPEYFVVEEFCALESRHGRMGVFIASPHFSTIELVRKVAQYSSIWA